MDSKFRVKLLLQGKNLLNQEPHLRKGTLLETEITNLVDIAHQMVAQVTVEAKNLV